MRNETCKLKLLVRVPFGNSGNTEVKYMVEGSQGSQIWGRRISSKNTKLSSIIHLINMDAMSIIF
jgi:hypothetical protein